MTVYGLDSGTANNELVGLNSTTLRRLGSLDAFDAGRLPSAIETWDAAQWTELAQQVANELDTKGFFPLGVDAALSHAVTGDCRGWEAMAGGFSTPGCLDPLPLDRGSEQQKLWVKTARLWTEVAFWLVTDHGWTLWSGEPVEQKNSRLLVEVYPRLSWLVMAGFTRAPIAYRWREVACRDGILSHLGLAWEGRRPNAHVRDAAMCAITAQRVMEGHAGFLGEPLQVRTRSFAGGGVALPHWTLVQPSTDSLQTFEGATWHSIQ